ncbi:MAG: rRNA pseudouridine synthase [Thermodesulfobacterium sp.]|nr:rRNA pseudouridine synthase [Thermodesulfobacterium sp.]
MGRLQGIIRLDKYLTHIGVSSRREAVKLIKAGKVKVNSKKVFDSAFKVNPEEDVVEVEGFRKIPFQEHFYYKFYKPKGCITSTKDKEPTIIELLPQDLPGFKRLFPAGRLDKDAEGLLILTTDGELAHRIMHPKWKLEKRYEVLLDKPITDEDIKRLEEGIELKEGKTLPARIKVLAEDRKFLEVAVREGRYHLIKRMFGKLGYQVLSLKRIAIGPVRLGDLKPAEAMPLSQEELESLKTLLALK